MKKFYLIILFAFLASLGSYITAAETWTKVTSAPDDWSGDYLIVYEAGSVAFDGSLKTLDAPSNTKSVTISDGTITTDGCDYYFTIEAKEATAGTYTIKNKSGFYIGKTSSSNNGINSSQSTPYTNTLSLKGGNISIKSSANMYLKYNTSDKRFRYYSSGQQAIQLYKKADANQVAAPTADLEPGTYNGARIVTLTSPDGTTINGLLNDETIVSTSNTYSKELIAVNGEKTTYTFEVWTEYNKNSSEIVTYKYIIDPSYVPDSYILCTDIKYLTPGTNVIFVGSTVGGTDCRVMTDFYTAKSYRKADATNVKVSDDGYTLENIGNAVVFTVAYDGSDDYKYSFFDSESNYLGSGTGSNSMTNQTAAGGNIPDKAKWSISLDANKNYNATILAKKCYSNYPYLRYNSGDPRFACYQLKFGAGLLRIYFNAKTSGVEKVALTDKKAKVYGANGNIVVEAEAAADVNVYNAAGMLVAAQKVGAGRTNIALAKGFYVVRAGNTVTKVAVR